MSKNQSKLALIADDHTLYRCGLALLLKDELGFSDVIEASSLAAAHECLAKTAAIDLALFDLRMPGMEGCASLGSVRTENPEMKLAVISASEEKSDVLAAIAIGLNGYIPKTLSNAHTVQALHDILDGRVYVPGLVTLASQKEAAPPSVESKSNGAQALGAPELRLTARQRDVFHLVCQGLMNREIAEKLNISEGTVKVHVSAMLSIFNLRSRSEMLTLK